MNKLTAAAAALLMTATGALAEEPQNDRAAKQEKRICKNEKMTGSLTRVRRICLTRSEWSRLAEGAQKGVDAITRDANQGFLDAVARNNMPGGAGS